MRRLFVLFCVFFFPLPTCDSESDLPPRQILFLNGTAVYLTGVNADHLSPIYISPHTAALHFYLHIIQRGSCFCFFSGHMRRTNGRRCCVAPHMKNVKRGRVSTGVGGVFSFLFFFWTLLAFIFIRSMLSR